MLKVQTVEKVVEVPMMGQTTQGTTREVDIPLAPRREDVTRCVLAGLPSIHHRTTRFAGANFFWSVCNSSNSPFSHASCISCARQEHPAQVVQQVQHLEHGHSMAAVLEVTVAQVIMGEDHPLQALAVCLYIAGMS